jgi:putative transposase
LLEEVDIDPYYLDLNNWPTVLVELLTPHQQKIFTQRKLAIDMYFKGCTHEEINASTGFERSQVSRVVKRCLSLDESGLIWGYRGLLPQKNLITYQRKSISSEDQQSTKLTGAFNFLLDKYPSIRDAIDDYYFRRRNKSVTDPIIKMKHLHRHFLDACRSAKINIQEYPFNTKDLARRSLYRYTKKLELNNPKEAAKRYGSETERRFKSEVSGQKNAVYIERPFQRVEFDAHTIDAIIAIKFKNIHGDEVVEIMERIWLLTIIDVATRVTLGYHICVSPQYAASDVLECIRNAIMPHQNKTLTIPGLKLPEKGGFHSILIPQIEWALWDEFSYDNGKANLASIVSSRLTEVVGCHVNPGPVSTPERRGIIERFFGLLEENGFQRLVNTTGSNSRDPKRKNPEKKAIKYEITIEEIEQLTEVLIANYNLEPHSALGYLSPLEVMEQRITQRDMLPRIKPEDERNQDDFLSFITKRKVCGSLKNGKRPYITFEGVTYRNEILSRNLNLIGEELNIVVNINDLRVVRAFLSDGTEFGYLTAMGKWGITPHTLSMRKQINKLVYRKMLYISQMDDPIECYQRYLEEEAEKKKKPRNQLENLRRYQQKSEEKNSHKQVEKINSEVNNQKPLSKKESNNRENELNSLRKRFKTITF